MSQVKDIGGMFSLADESNTARRTDCIKCPACKRSFRAFVVELWGYHGSHSVDCPYCGMKKVYAISCWRITAQR